MLLKRTLFILIALCALGAFASKSPAQEVKNPSGLKSRALVSPKTFCNPGIPLFQIKKRRARSKATKTSPFHLALTGAVILFSNQRRTLPAFAMAHISLRRFVFCERGPPALLSR
jgi:hypothetical protein